MSPSRSLPRPLPLGIGLILILSAVPALAQVPRPEVPEVERRSGLFTRMTPIIPHLPPDPDRDNYYNTYWQDQPKPTMENLFCHGGMYGSALIDPCPKCHYPYFQGKPGSSGTAHICQPPSKVARIWTNFCQPFRPVCYYYAGGCYSPVYDLDPGVPGPGPFPWPVFKKKHNGG